MIIGNEYNYLQKYFERSENDDGWIGYKVFGGMYAVPKAWELSANSWIEEFDLNTNDGADCGSGINVALNVAWVENFVSEQEGKDGVTTSVWKLFIPDDSKIVVPKYTDGKIRTNRAQLLEIVGELTYPYSEEDYEEDDDDDYYEDEDDEEDYDDGLVDFDYDEDDLIVED